MDIVEGLEANTSRGTVQRIVEWLGARPAGEVLDAPAGRGAVSAILAKRGFRVTALEIEPALVRAVGVPVVAADMNRGLPFESGRFDYAVCVDGIEHLENPFGLVREFARVLRPGGELFLSTPNISAFRSRARYLLTGQHNKGKIPLQEESPSPLHHINLLSFSECRYALRRAGFRLVEVRANRVKPAAWPFALLYPAAAIGTAIAFRHEKDPRQRELNREIYRQSLSWPVAMGETLILAARKDAAIERKL